MSSVSSQVDRSRTAAIYLLVSVLGISVVPLAMVVAGAPDSPFLFGAFLSGGTSIGALVFLRARYGSLLRDPRIVALIRKNVVSWPMLFILLGTFDFTFFAWATRFIDATVATILWGCWPIVFVFLLSRVFKGRQAGPSRYRRVTASLVVLMVFSLIGLAYVVLAQSSTQNRLDWTSDSSYIGFALVLASGVLISFNIFSFSWAAAMARRCQARSDSADTRSMELFFITVVICLSNAFTAPAKIAFSLAASEGMQLDVILVGLILGATLRVGSSILWRHANLITRALGINALGYAEPVFAVLWLALFWEVNIPRVDYLIIGTCAIISANILINSEVEIGPGFKSAILSLWAAGTVVYFRDQGPSWGSEKYFGSLILLAGVFILVLSIRLASATSATSGRHALSGPHSSKKGHLAPTPTLVRSRLDPVQLLTMIVYGAAAVSLAVFVRPVLTGWTGWTGWLAEMFTVFFSTAIVSSAFHAYRGNLNNRMRPATEAVNGKVLGSAHAVWEEKHRRIAVWTATLVAAGICLSFVYLLWDKWLSAGG